MRNSELFNEDNEATYCPEDDKLRLYVGRVPREEYLALKDEGWKSTPKQDCDFVAVWTAKREDTALSYAGIIGDEDQGPEDRAADRAERFAGYRDNRRRDAGELADRYDNAPSVFTGQNSEKTEKRLNQVERLADRAVNMWDKAEYWQSRTIGVINHALHNSSASVRMGRIKKLESELRSIEKDKKGYEATYSKWEKILDMEDAEKQTEVARVFSGFGYGGWIYEDPTRDDGYKTCLYSLLDDKKITGAEAAKMYLEKHTHPLKCTWRGLHHLKLRLEYENQMLEAQGGRAGQMEMIPGGWYCGHQIHQVNKSRETGRICSLKVRTNAIVSNYAWEMRHNVEGTDYALITVEVERNAPGNYREPTEEDLQLLKQKKNEAKKGKHKKPALINPTIESAKRLQEIWNTKKLDGYKPESWSNYKPTEITIITQEQYKIISNGSYGKAKTVWIAPDGTMNNERYRGNVEDGAICKVREKYPDGAYSMYNAHSVIVISDKPQKDLPEFVKEVKEEKEAANV